MRVSSWLCVTSGKVLMQRSQHADNRNCSLVSRNGNAESRMAHFARSGGDPITFYHASSGMPAGSDNAGFIPFILLHICVIHDIVWSRDKYGAPAGHTAIILHSSSLPACLHRTNACHSFPGGNAAQTCGAPGWFIPPGFMWARIRPHLRGCAQCWYLYRYSLR